MNKSENLKFILKRFDHYIESVQSKSNLFIVLNSLIVTGSITILNTKDLDKFNCIPLVLLIIIVLMSIVSIIMTLYALIPYLETSHPKSVLFFVDISSESEKDYGEKIHQISNEEFDKDIAKQIYWIAKGLTEKYEKLKWAGWLLISQFIMIIIIGTIIFIIKNK